jgi:hypothetical protein
MTTQLSQVKMLSPLARHGHALNGPKGSILRGSSPGHVQPKRAFVPAIECIGTVHANLSRVGRFRNHIQEMAFERQCGLGK